MSTDLKNTQLLKPGLLGKWIAEYSDIWQMQFISDQELGGLAGERGLSFWSLGDDVKRLWQLGLLRADLVISTEPLDVADLILVDEDGKGKYYYGDERLPLQTGKGFVDALVNLPKCPSYVELQFHPFRYYVLYHIDRVLRLNIRPMQMLYSADGYRKLLEHSISGLQRWSSGPDLRTVFSRWNNTTSLAVAAEPHTYGTIFGVVRYSGHSGQEYQQRLVQQHWDKFKESLQEIGIERIEKARGDLCVNAELLDPNKDVHLILRLTRGEDRLKRTEGRLGGAMYLLTMAEMLRRSAEEALGIELLEEDELGFGLNRGIKEHYYGVKRILDSSPNVKNEFVRKFGLDYGIRLRWYVEGNTEYGALDSFFGNHGPIDIVNLRGNVVAKISRGVAFRDNLRSDLRFGIFSFVSVDGDRGDYISAVRRAAEDDEICGMFFVSNPDFEFANFTVQELAQVIWEVAVDNGASLEEQPRLVHATADARSGREFFEAAKQAVPALIQFEKGKLWGKKLMIFAWNNPSMVLRDKTTKKRPIVEAVRAAMNSVRADYHYSRTEYKVDPVTGELVERNPSK